jgi:hypothetical protein
MLWVYLVLPTLHITAMIAVLQAIDYVFALDDAYKDWATRSRPSIAILFVMYFIVHAIWYNLDYNFRAFLTFTEDLDRDGTG